MALANHFIVVRDGRPRIEGAQYPTRAEAVAEANRLAAHTGRRHIVYKTVGQSVPASSPATWEDAT